MKNITTFINPSVLLGVADNPSIYLQVIFVRALENTLEGIL